MVSGPGLLPDFIAGEQRERRLSVKEGRSREAFRHKGPVNSLLRKVKSCGPSNIEGRDGGRRGP